MDFVEIDVFVMKSLVACVDFWTMESLTAFAAEHDDSQEMQHKE